MNKLSFLSSLISKIIILSICGTSIFLFSPHQATAQKYRDCAELQKRLNDKNPERMFQGFEKAEMQIHRSRLVGTHLLLYSTSFFCDGGTETRMHKDGIKKICNGYIQYYSSPYWNGHGLIEQFGAGSGKYFDRWNFSDSDSIKSNCRQVS